MIGLPQLIASLEPIEGGWRGHIPDSWLQGRTSYGGLSAALALHAAQQADSELPPLRSAQVAFIGPLAGDIAIRAMRLRRGRNATWVQADVESAAGLGLRAVFVFMGPLDGAVDHVAGRPPDFPVPTPDTTTYFGTSRIPFTQNFELLDDRTGANPHEWLRWARLRERAGLDPAVELIAVADALPPAALKVLGRPVPISSVTWQLNLLGAPATTEGWWLLRSTTDYARSGASSQFMHVWNTAGEAVAEQTQAVALFA